MSAQIVSLILSAPIGVQFSVFTAPIGVGTPNFFGANFPDADPPTERS
jgi:hypothetical protein